MATNIELAPRVLRKLGILAVGQTASAEDQELALQKLKAVHASLKADGALRWTLGEIPDFAEEPYVMMAAYLAAPEFGLAADPSAWMFGLSEIQSGVRLRSIGPVCAEYF